MIVPRGGRNRRGGCSQGFGISSKVLECSQDFGVALRVLELLQDFGVAPRILELLPGFWTKLWKFIFFIFFIFGFELPFFKDFSWKVGQFFTFFQNPGNNSKILGILQNPGSNSKTLRAAIPPSLKEVFFSGKELLKGTVNIISIFKRPSMEREQCPTYNGTLETLTLTRKVFFFL